MKTKSIFLVFLIIIGLYIYPKLKKRLGGFYDDRVTCSFYGFGEPFTETLNNGSILKIGPYRYELEFDKYNTEKHGVVSNAKLTGQVLEITEDGWTIPKNYTYSDNSAEYTYSKPIFWKGQFDLEVKKSEAHIKASLKSTNSKNVVEFYQEIPVIKTDADYDYDEYKLDTKTETCFDLLIGEQNVRFCDTPKAFLDSMIDLVEKRYNKKLSENRKNQIYSKYEN